MQRFIVWVIIGSIFAVISNAAPTFFKLGCGVPIIGTALGGLLWSIYALLCPSTVAMSLGAVAVAMIAGWTAVYVLWSALQGISNG